MLIIQNLDATVIPGTVKSQVSIRIVPDQDLETISHSLRDHLTSSFSALDSPNKLQVRVCRSFDSIEIHTRSDRNERDSRLVARSIGWTLVPGA